MNDVVLIDAGTGNLRSVQKALEFEPNNARIDDYNLLNMKVSKLFRLGSDENPWMNLTIYLDGRNVLDSQNVLWVDSSGRPGGELGDLTAWGPGRRIRLGIRAEI